MQVLFETQEITLPKQARMALLKRIEHAMKQTAASVRRLSIHLRDVNGEKGGRDKFCTISARLESGGEVVIVNKGDNASQALFKGIERCRRRVAGQVNKQQRKAQRGRSGQLRLKNLLPEMLMADTQEPTLMPAASHL